MKMLSLSILSISALLCSAEANAVMFNGAEPMNDSELSAARGGFITSSGLQIDFGLTNRTLIDGVQVSQVELSQNDLTNMQPSDYQKRVEVNDGGTTVTPLNIPGIPAIVTLIQNTVDNKLIQNFTLMDLNVKNLDSYRMVALTPLLNYNNTLNIK